MERSFGDLIYSSDFATDLGYRAKTISAFIYLSVKKYENKNLHIVTLVPICIKHKQSENKSHCIIEVDFL